MQLTICFLTNRRDSLIDWFLSSLRNECRRENFNPNRIVIIDFFSDSTERILFLGDGGTIQTRPKPCIWQGAHRVTKQDYFAASNARNTALCYALDGYIAYVDDLSVLIPGWLARVRAAMEGGYVACGAYQKVENLVVENGDVKSYTPIERGIDHRSKHAPQDRMTEHSGSWFYGCSIAAPVQAFLDVNGWDEDCDSMGAEDYACGMMIHRAGYKLFYDPQMKTLESEELHHVEKPFLRIDKKNVRGHKDASHAYLAMIQGDRKRAPNYFGEGGITTLRQRILAGEPFPIPQIPQHDWRDGQLISEM